MIIDLAKNNGVYIYLYDEPISLYHGGINIDNIILKLKFNGNNIIGFKMEFKYLCDKIKCNYLDDDKCITTYEHKYYKLNDIISSINDDTKDTIIKINNILNKDNIININVDNNNDKSIIIPKFDITKYNIHRHIFQYKQPK